MPDGARPPLALHNPFWRFSLRVYAAPGVATECLEAQAALGLDVNVLLFCAWLGAKLVRVAACELESITARLEPWHRAIVKPLRASRQALKTMPEMDHPAVRALREAIAADELRAEQIEHALLFATFDPAWVSDRAGSREDIVRANVARYLARHGGDEASCPRLVAAAVALGDILSAP